MDSKKIKINQAVLIYMAVVSAIAFFCLGFLWISSVWSNFEKEEIRQRAVYLENKKAIIRSEVDQAIGFIRYMQSKTEIRLRENIKHRVYEAYAIADNIYKQESDKRSLDEIKALVIHALRPIRYNHGRGYFFAFDLNGIERLFASQPEYEGQNMMTVRGGSGELVVPEMLDRVADNGEGFYHYTWPKPGSEGYFPKIAFVKLFEPFGWVLGTGEYVDDVLADIQQECLDWISTISFGDGGYVFAGQWDGLSLSGPAAGKNMYDFEDKNGVKIVQELINASKSGGGFVQYVMPPLDGRQQAPKLSYAASVPEWQWYIGSGMNIDEIESEIAGQRTALGQIIKTTIRNIVLVLMALLTLVILAVRFLSNRIGDNVQLFRKFFSRSATEAVEIESQTLYFAEFEQLADAANQMVAQRKLVESALRESEEKFRLTFDASPDAIVICRLEDGIYIDVNEGFTQLTGFSKADVYGKTPQDIRLWYHPEERQRLLAEVEKNGWSYNLEARLQKKDGNLTTGLVSSRIINLKGVPHIICITRDISDRKQAEEQLRASQERFREIAELLPETVYEMDLEGKLTFVNRSAFDHFKYTEQDFQNGLMALDMLVPDDRPRARENIKKVLSQTDSVLSQYTALRKDGSTFPVLFKSAPIVHQDKPVGMRGIIIDITDKQQMEERLRQAQKMEAVGTLAGGIAHDFNNILSPLIGYTELLKVETDPQSSQYKFIEGIYQAAMRARELVKQILLFSRNAAQEVKPLNLQPLVKEALKLLQASLPSTIEMHQNIDPKCGLVIADPTQIHQIVMNLGTNAYHAMEESGGRLTVSLQQVVLDKNVSVGIHSRATAFACLTFSDTGVGMPKAVLDKIFDPYFTTKEKGKGTGLGLSVVQGIVQNSGGFIRVKSIPGKGSDIKIFLPIDTNTSMAIDREPVKAIRGGNERILVIDDEESIVNMMHRMLEKIGYQVTSFNSVIKGLDAFKAAPENFDLIITDMTMPKMTGDKLAQEVIQIKPDVPVIICTGFSEKMNWEKATALGIKGFLMKPVIVSELSVMIRTVLDGRSPST